MSNRVTSHRQAKQFTKHFLLFLILFYCPDNLTLIFKSIENQLGAVV